MPSLFIILIRAACRGTNRGAITNSIQSDDSKQFDDPVRFGEPVAPSRRAPAIAQSLRNELSQRIEFNRRIELIVPSCCIGV